MEQKTYTLNDGRQIHIRALTASDKKLLADFYESMSEHALRWSEAPTLHQIDDKFSYPDYYISLVIVHEGKIVGYGEILKDSKKRDGELLIHIHQDYQSAGLGTAMMIMLVKEATEQMIHAIHLSVAASNTKAVHLFRKCGFQEQHTTQNMYSGELHDTLHMIKVLNR
jgi:ribosomal protein S18 acetylase RimI-like enzyme